MAALWCCRSNRCVSSLFKTNWSATSNFQFTATRHWTINVNRKWYSSGSLEDNSTLKKSRDEPVRFSTSKAKRQTLDDTLGAQKSDSSFPFYLGFGVLAFIMYFGFIRSEDPSEAERWDLLRMRNPQEQGPSEETTNDGTPAEKGSPLS